MQFIPGRFLRLHILASAPQVLLVQGKRGFFISKGQPPGIFASLLI